MGPHGAGLASARVAPGAVPPDFYGNVGHLALELAQPNRTGTFLSAVGALLKDPALALGLRGELD